jgi:hypothetical protein
MDHSLNHVFQSKEYVTPYNYSWYIVPNDGLNTRVLIGPFRSEEEANQFILAHMLNTDIGHTYTTRNANTEEFQTRFPDLTTALTQEEYLSTIFEPIPELPYVEPPGPTYPLSRQPVQVYTHCAVNQQRQ